MGNGRLNKKGILFGFFVFLLALFLSLWINFSNLNFYKNFRIEAQDYDYIGKTPEELEIITKDLIRYIQFGGVERLEKHFNDKEVLHMYDVRLLFLLSLGIIIFSFSICIYLYRYKREKSFYYSAAMGLILLLIFSSIIGFFLLKNFYKAFIKFHEIFFFNDLWLLNPETDIMIRILPQNLFMRLFKRIILLFLIFILSLSLFFAKRSNCEN